MTLFNECIDLKSFFRFNIFLGTYQLCPVEETFEYTFDNVKVGARCCFGIYVGNGLFMVYFKSYLLFVVRK